MIDGIKNITVTTCIPIVTKWVEWAVCLYNWEIWEWTFTLFIAIYSKEKVCVLLGLWYPWQ